LYRETHVLLEDLAEAVAEGTRKQFMESVATVPLLIIDDFGMRKLPPLFIHGAEYAWVPAPFGRTGPTLRLRRPPRPLLPPCSAGAPKAKRRPWCCGPRAAMIGRLPVSR
jgi:hypothetical protein